MDSSHPASDSKTYDLNVSPRDRRLVWSYSDHGVTLTNDTVAWSADGQESQASLRDILEVHLQISYIGQNAIANCRLRFAQGSVLVITSGNGRGYPDAALDQLYVDFIRDLHARLAARRDGNIAFTSGISEGRLTFGILAVFIGGLFFVVAPVLMFAFFGAWKLALVAYGGFALVWRAYKSLQANAPRTYDPGHVPEELMPARLNLPPQINPIVLDSLD